MNNPFKTAREALRLSHKDVADKTGLTKIYVLRQEQGIYPNPSDKLIEFYSQENHFTRELFRRDYKKYQSWCRQQNGPHGNPVLYPVNPNALFYACNSLEQEDTHPFRVWMNWNGKKLSGMAVCKAYCVRADIVNRFLNEHWHVKTLPGVLQDVLHEAGYSLKLLGAVDELYRNWRSHA